jgi:hypothetical protein
MSFLLSTRGKKQERTDSDFCYLSTDQDHKGVTARKMCKSSPWIVQLIESYLDGRVRSSDKLSSIGSTG